MSIDERMADFAADDVHEATAEELGRPTGQQVFDSLSPEKQDEMLGPEAAQKVRDGEATLADFVKTEGGFITQRPTSDL